MGVRPFVRPQGVRSVSGRRSRRRPREPSLAQTSTPTSALDAVRGCSGGVLGGSSRLERSVGVPDGSARRSAREECRGGARQESSAGVVGRSPRPGVPGRSGRAGPRDASPGVERSPGPRPWARPVPSVHCWSPPPRVPPACSARVESSAGVVGRSPPARRARRECPAGPRDASPGVERSPGPPPGALDRCRPSTAGALLLGRRPGLLRSVPSAPAAPRAPLPPRIDRAREPAASRRARRGERSRHEKETGRRRAPVGEARAGRGVNPGRQLTAR